jgi:BirA family biotin operon repressor/biotin-[acetyl-CoA-carboxylase] ligase
LKVERTDSTNSLLRQLIAEGNPPEFIYAGFQTAGRGQTGNGWESAPDKNLLCSILLPARKNLFELNIVVAVAVRRLLGEGFTIKWPNDIYWGDKKIAGILIENAIIGNEVRYSIGGIGLNVNQTEWQSGAPNPISLKQITGKDHDIDELMQRLYAEVQKALNEDVWEEYKAHLYRREGFWPFVEREVNTAPTMNASSQTQGQFMARIEDVLPAGEIVLRDEANTQRIYHFKQIRYVV